MATHPGLRADGPAPSLVPARPHSRRFLPDPSAEILPHDSDLPSMWRGKLIGEAGSARGTTIRLLLSLSFEVASRVTGDGRGFDFGPDTTGQGVPLTVDGGATGAECRISLWFWRPKEIARAALVCTGTLDSQQMPQRIDGAWDLPCFMGETCGCSGGSGRFWLRRQSEPGSSRRRAG